jgi:hypothetical protein
MATAQNYTKQINIYDEQYSSILDDYKKAYINYNLNPTSDQYLRTYNLANGAITTINSQLFATTADIQQSINALNKTIPNIGGKIDTQKILHSKLANKHANINGSSHGAYRLINEVKDIYKTQYSVNVALFIGIIIALVLMSKIFRSSSIVSASSSSSISLPNMSKYVNSNKGVSRARPSVNYRR